MNSLSGGIADGVAQPSGALYRRVWRWHFYAGLICLPFLISLAVTGALYLFRNEIEDIVYRQQLMVSSVPAQALRQSPRQLVDAALRAQPGTARAYTAPADPARNAQIDVATAHGLRQVFINPYTGELAGVIDSSARLMTVVKHIHSLTLIGNWAKYIIEVVAGWLLVLVSTGVYLWWPRGRSGGVLSVRGTPAQRIWWRDAHAVAGALVAVALAFLALTGMPWSVFWGANVNRMLAEHGWGVPGAMWKHVPRSTVPMTQLGDVPWTMRPETLPLSDAHAGHEGHEGHAGMQMDMPASAAAAGLDLNAAVAMFGKLGLRDGYRLSLPSGASGVYSAVAASNQVAAQRVVHLDRYSGRVLADIGYADFGPAARVTEWGVSVHKGLEYGRWNQCILLLACLTLLFLSISGPVMWWRRRPAGKLAAPPRRHRDQLAAGVLTIAITLGVVFPILGLSMLIAAAIDSLGRMKYLLSFWQRKSNQI